MGKRTRLCRYALVIIMGLFLLTLPACGRKGDPIPPQPEQPKAGTSTQQPDKPTGVTPGK
jgi:predicted small lipoprotein YifL